MQDLLTFLGRSPEKAGGTFGPLQDKHTDGRGTGGVLIGVSWRLSWRLPFGGQAWSHPIDLRLQCWDVLDQTTNRARTQPHISADIAP